MRESHCASHSKEAALYNMSHIQRSSHIPQTLRPGSLPTSRRTNSPKSSDGSKIISGCAIRSERVGSKFQPYHSRDRLHESCAEKQAIFLTTKSETSEATAITIDIIERFEAYERGKVKPVARIRRPACGNHP